MTQITIPNVATEISYSVILASTGPFTVPFPFFVENDVQAEVTDALGVITALVVTTDFVFTTKDVPVGQEGNGFIGGTITLNVSIGADAATTIRIFRSIIKDRTSNYPNTGPFSMPLLNDEQNKHIAIMQEIDANASALELRSVRAPTRDVAPSMELPIAAIRAGKFLRFADVSGDVEPAEVTASTTILSQSIIAGFLFPQTPDELAAGVTPVNLEYDEGNVLRYATNTTPGTTDMTAAIQTAINIRTGSLNGGKVVIPKGFYSVTSTINVGLPKYSAFEFLTQRTTAATGVAITANTIAANILSNQDLSHAQIEFEVGATLIANWTPALDEPVLSYNLPQGEAPSRGVIKNPTIIAPSRFSGGEYIVGSDVPENNNLIGIFFSSGCAKVDNVFTSGIAHGVLCHAAYWTHLTNVRNWGCGSRCVDISNGNAMTVDNLAMWYSTQGVVFDGDAAEVRGIHTEQVLEDLTVFTADTCTFGPGYLEDIEGGYASGVGKYAITLGVAGDLNTIISCIWDNLRVGAVRNNKKGLRIWDTRNGTFTGVRLYSHGHDRDTLSSLSFVNCDFGEGIPHGKTTEFVSGATVFANYVPIGSENFCSGPWTMNANGIAPGSIPALGSFDHDITLPASMNAAASLIGTASYTSGGNVLLVITTRIVAGAPNKFRLTFANPTAGAIDPGTFNVKALIWMTYS